MSASAWISQIKLKSGTELNLGKDSIVVFVGPNNSGKSKILDEVEQQVRRQLSTPSLIVESISMNAKGTIEEFKQSISYKLFNGQYLMLSPRSSINVSQVERSWAKLLAGNIEENFYIGDFIVNSLSTINRLELVLPAGNIDFLSEPRKHPIHTIKEETDKELSFSHYFKIAFGEDVIVNHAAGKSIPLHIGKRPKISAENDRVSTSYQKELRALPYLHEQGDGMKSFAGVFLSLISDEFHINILDEPEAFLHPPQASLLAKMVAQNIGKEKQLFTSTHSEHFLKGLLDGAADRLTIVRIERDGPINNIHILGNDEIKEIWNDSFMRHSNVLDGLFHKKVILVESDSDARFYSTITDEIVDNESMASPDLLFVPTGGKHRFPFVIKALNKLSVPLKVIGDFDLYHDENPIKQMVEVLGGDWSLIESDFKKIKKAIDQKRPELETADLKQEIEKVFDSFNDRIIPETKIKEIQSALKRSSPWVQAKSSGKAYLPAGDITSAFQRVQEQLSILNIHVLEIGEIEAFDKTIGGHGPRWTAKVLERDLLNAPELDLARRFIKEKILAG